MNDDRKPIRTAEMLRRIVQVGLPRRSERELLVFSLSIIVGFVLAISFIVTALIPGISGSVAKPPPVPRLWSFDFVTSKAYWYTVLSIIVGLIAIASARGNIKRFRHGVSKASYRNRCLLLVLFTPMYCLFSTRLTTLELSDLSKTIFFLLFTVYYLMLEILTYAEIYALIGGLKCNGEITTKPADCLYFSGVTWTTLGYGDIVPESELARFFAVVEALNAYVFLGTFLAVFAHIGIGV